MLILALRSFLSSLATSDATGMVTFTFCSVSRIWVVTMKKNRSMNTISERELDDAWGTSFLLLELPNFDIMLTSYFLPVSLGSASEMF